MTKLFQNKKPVIILSIVLALLLATGAGILIWQLTKDDGMYTVTFVSNGGSEIESMTVEKGTVLSQTELPVPTKRGSMFLAWNTDEDLTAPYWDAPIESDITLYASYLAPADDAEVTELTESVIPFADTDFSVTVRSAEELTSDNLGKYALLRIDYGKHENGEEIKLSVASEGGGIYRLSGNFVAGGKYSITLISDAVTFNEEDETLKALGLTDALRVLSFMIIGENFTEGELSDKVADIPAEDIVSSADNTVVLSGNDHGLISPDGDHGVIKVGDSEDITSYYKVEGIASVNGDSVTYKVRPAEAEEVYDRVEGYFWDDLDEDDYVINEEVKAQVIENIKHNEQLNNYVKYLTAAATETPTYQTLSEQEFGKVVAMPLSTIVTPVGITIGLEKNAHNPNFDMLFKKSESSHKFLKLTLGVSYEVKIAKLGSVGSITCYTDLLIDFWIFIGIGGHVDVGWFSYDFDVGSSVLTQTEITFNIGLQTASGKKYPNIDEEIQAIFDGITDSSPENLLSLYNELMSGGSEPIELFNQEIFKVPIVSVLFGAVDLSIPVSFVVSMDMQANFMSYFTVLTYDNFGMYGNDDDGVDAYHESLPTRYKYTMELRGRFELRAGVEIAIRLKLGYGFASVSVGMQAGLYAEVCGFFYYDVDHMNFYGSATKSMGGAYYLELGLYLDIRVRAEVCRIKYSGSLWDKKFPFYSAGQKEVLYGFVNPTADVITLENTGSMNLADTGVWDVYLYDITKERSASNPRKVEDYPFDPDKFEITFADPTLFEISGKEEIWVIKGGSVAMETTMIAKYKGNQMSLRDAITKYITVRFVTGDNADEVDWDKLSSKCRIDFMIDGKVIFSREYPYGQYFAAMGTDISYVDTEDDEPHKWNLRTSDLEAMYAAGYGKGNWEIRNYITEDMQVEATSSELRKVDVIVHTNLGEYPISVTYGDTPELEHYEDERYISTDQKYLEFEYWSPELAPVTEDGIHYYANYKLNTVNVTVNIAETTVNGETFAADTMTWEVPIGSAHLDQLLQEVPIRAPKSLRFYSDAAYTIPLSMEDRMQRVNENATCYVRYEDIGVVYYYNHYGTFIKGEELRFGEYPTALTEEEMKLFTYLAPEELASGNYGKYVGMTINYAQGTELMDVYGTPMNRYVLSVYPVFGEGGEYYNVTFLDQNGEICGQAEVRYGSDASSFFTLPGYRDDRYEYTFKGWQNRDNPEYGSIALGADTFEPVFEVASTIEYTITINNTAGVTLSDGSPLPAITEKVSYDELESFLDDWFALNRLKKTDQNRTYTLKDYTYQTLKDSGVCYINLNFGQASASVTYDAGAGKLTLNGKEVASATAIDAELNGEGKYIPTYSALPNDTSKVLVGWQYKGVTYAVGEGIPLTIGEDATLVAVYGQKDHTITLTNGNETTTLYGNAGETLPLLTPTKASTAQYTYTFSGWRSTDGTLYRSNTTYTVKGNDSLTAEFTETLNTYTVTFDAAGGSFSNGSGRYTVQVAYGSKPNAPSNPIRAQSGNVHYTFSHWSSAIATVTGDTTYKAVYTEITLYTITFSAGNGQFDSAGTKTMTLTVAAGEMPNLDHIRDPYRKTDAGYYDFDKWSPTVVAANGNVTYTATYKSELSDRTGITVSDGTNSEDIVAFLNGTSKIKGYAYVLDNEFYGKALTVTAPGLTITGDAKDIHIDIVNVNVTLKDLSLEYSGDGHVNAMGKVNMTIEGTVRVTTNRAGDAIRGDNMDTIGGVITLQGADDDSKLVVDSVLYGIAVYGTLNVKDLKLELTTSVEPTYEEPTAAALQVHDSTTPGKLTIGNSTVTVYEGAVNAAELVMTDSKIDFKASTFTPGVVSGLYIMRWSDEYFAADMALISLTRSQISFTHDIAIAIRATDYDTLDYSVNHSEEVYGISGTYTTLSAFLADVSANGYSGMVVIDNSSKID